MGMVGLGGKIVKVEKGMWEKGLERDEVKKMIEGVGVGFGVEGEEERKKGKIEKVG